MTQIFQNAYRGSHFATTYSITSLNIRDGITHSLYNTCEALRATSHDDPLGTGFLRSDVPSPVPTLYLSTLDSPVNSESFRYVCN